MHSAECTWHRSGCVFKSEPRAVTSPAFGDLCRSTQHAALCQSSSVLGHPLASSGPQGDREARRGSRRPATADADTATPGALSLDSQKLRQELDRKFGHWIGRLRSGVHVQILVNLVRKLGDADFETTLDLLEHLLILRGGHKCDAEAFRAEPASSTDTMQIRVRLPWDIVVDGDVDPLDIDTAAKDVRADGDALLECLELLVPGDPVAKVRIKSPITRPND